MENLLNTQDVAERYGVKTTTVYEWIKAKRLTAIKIGKGYRIRQSDIKKFESKNRTT